MKGGKRKRKKLTNLNACDEDSGDEDSGSDFRLSEELSEDADSFIDDGGSDSEEYNYGEKKKGRGGGQPSRRSTRSRRSRLDDDFVVDGSDSEDYAPKKKKSKWASETSEEESDSDYGKKKKKRGGGKAKKPKGLFTRKPQRGGGGRRRRDWSEESDFSDRPRKKKARNTIPSSDLDRSNIVESAGRRTRGVKVNYSLLEGSSDEAAPEPAKGKGKGPRKWDGSEDEFKPDSDVEKVEEDVLGEEEEEDSE